MAGDAAISRADLLSLLAVIGYLISLILPWLSADEPVLVTGGQARTSMAGYHAFDVLLLTGVVVVCGLLTLLFWLARDRRMLAGMAIGVAGLVVIATTGIYLLDPFLGLTTGALTYDGVSAGIGVYVALLSGIGMLAASINYLREDRHHGRRPPIGLLGRFR